MPLYDVSVEGVIYEVDAPDERTAWQWANYTHRQRRAAQPPAPKESTIGSEFVRGTKQLFSTSRTGIGALTSPEEAARAGVERSQQIAAEAGEGPSLAAVRKAYEERGLLPAVGEVVSQIPRAVAGQVPQLAAMAGGAKLGAMAGAGVGSVVPVVGTGLGAIAGGVLGAGATLLPQFFGANVERQAAEQMQRGEPVSIDRGTAAAAAAGQAGIEAAGTALVLGKRVVKGILGVTDDTALATAKAREELVKAAARSRSGAALRGAGVGLAEIPVEVAQAVIERAQAGLDVLSPEALSEYGENAYLAGLVGPTIGAAARVTEPGAAKRKLAVEEQAKEAEARAAAAKAEEEKKAQPEYALQLDADYQAAVARMKELQAAVPKKPGKDALPEERAAYQEAVDARTAHLKDVLQPLTEEYRPRKAEIAQLKEQQRVAAMSEEEYADYSYQQALKRQPRRTPIPETPEELSADFADIAPPLPAPKPAPELAYAQQRMSLAQQQDQGAFEAKDFAEYLMQDPAMAQRLVDTKTPIPGVDQKTGNAILGGLKLQLQAREKEARATTAAQLQQQQADLKAQQPVAEEDPLALWKASVEETEEQATEELLRPNMELIRPAGPAIVAVPSNITPIQNPGTLLKRLDDLVATRDRAAADTDTAFAAGNKELGVKKSQEREAAQVALNNLEQAEGPGRALVALRKAQDTALMNTAQLADDLRAGRTLGGPEASTASSTPKTLVNQINKQRDAFVTAAVQEAATTRRLFGKSLTQEEAETAAKQMRDVFNEWVTRSMAQPRSAVDMMDQMLASAEAEKALRGAPDVTKLPFVVQARAAYVQQQMQDALAKRLGRQRMEEIAKGTAELKGAETELPVDTRRAIYAKATLDFNRAAVAAQKKALEQSTDPRPLEERRFGAYRAATQVLQEQLEAVAAKLRTVPRAPQRVEPALKMQFPETEAAKVAEARGETAQTLEGALRRRRDYVEGLIDQAFQTRRVPGIAEVLLTRARDFLPQATGDFLDAAENIASRILRGQNIERSDLVTMRDELRAASARPGQAEVVGEREGQRELFPAEARRAELGVIRETRRNFENAPIVRKSRALLAKGKQLVEDINAAWDAMNQRAEALRAVKVGEAEEDVARKRKAYKETFSAALARYRVEEATAPIQKQINDTINTLAAIGKQRAKAVKLKDKEAAADLDVIRKAEQEALVELRQQLDAARSRPGYFVEAAEMPKGATRVTREATLPYEIKALTDEWVVFERERLAKAEAKLEKLKGPERQEQSKVVTEQRAAVVDAEQAQRQAAMRAQQGLGLPGVRRVAGKTEAIPSAAEQAKARQEAETERRATEREAAETSRQVKEAKQTALEEQVLDLGTEIENQKAAFARAKTQESKTKIGQRIAELTKQAQIAEAQLAAMGEAKPRRKGPATVPTGTALGKRTPLRTGTGEIQEEAARFRAKEANILAEQLRAQTPAQKARVKKQEAAIAEETQQKKTKRELKASAYEEYGPFFRETGPQYETRELTDLNAATREALEDGDIRTALADLEKNGSTPFVRELAKRLGDMTMRTKLEVRDKVEHKGEEVEGAYVAAENLVLLHRNALSEEALTHELTHAATMRALEADPATLTPAQRAARKEIENLYAAIQKQPDFAREYGRKDVKEFVSELMSNLDFRNKLDAQKPSFLRRMYDAFMRLIGFPRAPASEQAVKAAYALFMPSQAIKAAPAASARRGAPGLATANRVADALIAKEKGFFTKLKENFLGMGGRTQFVDKLAPTEEALKRGGTDPTKALQAMYYLRMYDQRMHFTSQSITDGVPELVEKTRADGKTERIIETKPGANIQQIVNILKAKDVVKAAGSPDAANKLFTLYLAAIRGDRVGYSTLNFGRVWAEAEVKRIESQLKSTTLSQEQRSVLQKRRKDLTDKIPTMPTEADIKAARAEIEADPTLKKAFDEARDIYNQYNRNLLEFSVQTGALSRDEANKYLRNNDYIPYYRMRDGVAELVIGNETPIRIGNLKDSPHLKELVGGDEAIFDFLTSSVQNTSMLLDMATKNLATKNLMFELRDVGLATISKVPKSGKTPEGAVTFKRDGEDYFAVVDTDTLGIDSELLVKGLAGIPTMFPAFIRVLGIPARLLRRVVVASPVYMARQLFRDSLAATLSSGADMVPVLSSLQQIGKPKALQGRGITGGQVFTGMPEDQTRMLKDMQAGKISVTSGLAWLEAKSAQVDALTREAQYENYRKQGLSEMEATLMALESMNFSKRGLSPTMHMASTLIPFFNAQIQGLDVLYKAFTGQMPLNERLAIREKLWTRGLMLAGLSMAYAVAMQDDETYKNAKPEEKYGNWFVRVPGFEQMVRLPIPFELGYIFKALPEAMVNIVMNEKGGEEAAKALTHIVKQTIPGGSSYLIPQALKPALEALAFEKSLYTGRSIESAKEQMMEPGFRYRENTTALAREVGELTGFSPIKMEFLISGYFGTMGMALLAALSAPFGKEGPESATKRASDMPVVGTLFQPNDASGIIDATYERMKQIDQVKETYEGLIQNGRIADANKYLTENASEMALASVAGSFKQVMGEVTKYEREVRASNLSPEEKRKRLDEARQIKIRIASSVRAMAGKKEPQAALP